MRNRCNDQTKLRMSTVEAILLVVVDVKDGSPTGPLVPGHVRQVSVGGYCEQIATNLGFHNLLQEMEGCNRADPIVGGSRGTRDRIIMGRK